MKRWVWECPECRKANEEGKNHEVGTTLVCQFCSQLFTVEDSSLKVKLFDLSVLLTPVELAAVRWWLMRRPVGWTLQQMLEESTVNCIDASEDKLAEAVAHRVEKVALQAVDRDEFLEHLNLLGEGSNG